MTDWLQSIGNGLNNIANETGKEFDRIGKRVDQSIKDDGKEITDAIHKNGLVGGALACTDVFSLGHQTANGLYDLGLVHDHATRQAIACGVNLCQGGLIPALYEGFDALGSMQQPAGQPGGQPGAQPAPGQYGGCAPYQGNYTPMQGMQMFQANIEQQMQREAMKEAAKHKAAEKTAYRNGFDDGVRAGSHMDGPERPNGGYAGGGWDADCGCAGNDYASLMDKLHDKYGDDKCDHAKSKIDEIMNNPNLSFEDKIFELMMQLMEDGEKDVKGLTDELDKDDAQTKKMRGKLDDQITGVRKELDKALAANPPDQGKIAQLNNKIAGLSDQRVNMLSDRSESRQKISEKIKNAVTKLSEMQQALSNVLNAMHESSMAAIRNIK